MNFIQYITNLAPEGETVLFVKQKPVGKELQFHADGAIKCVWPAYLPEKYTGKGAWYCNTAMFIISRFGEKLSASAANCERVGFLVLDDIGTKSKAPDLEPTWKIETSPDNYQWGYTFALDDQPLKGEYTAAYDAIAEAGYTDPGARNPVRNFRLPGSVNLKPERNGFEAKLVDFHPEREFSLPQICEALGVVPKPADTAAHKAVRVADDGNDDVVRWLSSNGLVIRAPNAEGWMGIVCPNSAEHTDGNPEGRYLPASRAYCCLHSHCLEFGSSEFLQWVVEQGGPKHSPGLRDELLAEMHSSTLSKLKPSDMFSTDAESIIAEVERKELGRMQKADWFTSFAYIQNDDSYFDLQDRREIARGTFNALFRHISCTSIHNAKRKVEASVCFDENRQHNGAPAIVGVTYSAGDDVLVTRDGDVYGNRWRDARPEPKAGDITPWLDHCKALIPDPRELEHIWNVMAFKLQNPRVKINHAVLHGGDQGCGKDSMWAPFIWSVCGEHLKNRGLLDNDSLGSQWGYQLESEILIINELREPDARERRALANKLKPIIAAPPEMLSINRKGLHPYDMVNRMFVLAFSNDPVPISLDSQDRRWFCTWSDAPRMQPEAAQALWAWYKTGGFAAVAAWLAARNVSAFNPAATPPWTDFKANLIEHGMSIAESYLVELIRERRLDFARGVLASPFHAVCDRLAANAPAGVKLPQAALLHALKEAGWVDCGRLMSSDLKTKKHIYAARDMVENYSKSELRRMVESAPPDLKVIKTA